MIWAARLPAVAVGLYALLRFAPCSLLSLPRPNLGAVSAHSMLLRGGGHPYSTARCASLQKSIRVIHTIHGYSQKFINNLPTGFQQHKTSLFYTFKTEICNFSYKKTNIHNPLCAKKLPSNFVCKLVVPLQSYFKLLNSYYAKE